MRRIWRYIVRHLRTIAYLIVLGLAIYFAVTNRAEISSVMKALGDADGRWLLVAIAAQILWLVLVAGILKACYRLMGIDENLLRMVPLIAAANFINVVAPSYGAGAVAVFVADGRQRGKPAGKVSTASLIYTAYDYLGMLLFITIGFIILSAHHLMKPGYIVAAIFVFAIGISLVFIMTVGVFAADRLEQVLTSLAGWVNRRLKPLLRRDLLKVHRIAKFARDIEAGLKEIRRTPSNLIQPAILTVARKLSLILILYLVSIAYRQPLELPNLVATFSISYLFTIASFTPSGVGFVETAMPVTMNSFGISFDKAVAIALAYRGITFWLTLAYGLIAVRWVGYKETPQEETQPVAPTSPQLLAHNPDSINAPANPGSQAEIRRKPLSPPSE